MTSIQIDMFEVQLGAGILIQFRAGEDRVIRILADAGVQSKTYPVDHVHGKLREAFDKFGDSSCRIDLIIATHYDADHLRGLVPIIRDANIQIGEAWLPPVANDTESRSGGRAPRVSDLLVNQLSGALAETKLSSYLKRKRETCDALRFLDLLATLHKEGNASLERIGNIGDAFIKGDSSLAGFDEFERHRAEAVRRLGTDNEGHADDQIFEPPRLPLEELPTIFNWLMLFLGVFLFAAPWRFHFTHALRESLNCLSCGALIAGLALLRFWRRLSWILWINLAFGSWLVVSSFVVGFHGRTLSPELVAGFALLSFFGIERWFRYRPPLQTTNTLRVENAPQFIMRWHSNPSTIDPDRESLAFIRRAAANDAINIKALAEVVRALQERNIRGICRKIRDGEPQTFSWNSKEGRFVPGRPGSTKDPELLLLGPSAGLVTKHWHRLPIARHMYLATFARLPVEAITPSNQLSYVARLRYAEQGILITGDAGCVDFKPRPRAKFDQRLLDALLPLHVVQVAHHAGHNAEFYNVLLEAGYASQRNQSWLLISHATRDRHRPSDIFKAFAAQLQAAHSPAQLLFTSRPTHNRVRGFVSLISAHTCPPGDVGDVRLSFVAGRWKVINHSIEV